MGVNAANRQDGTLVTSTTPSGPATKAGSEADQSFSSASNSTFTTTTPATPAASLTRRDMKRPGRRLTVPRANNSATPERMAS